MPTKLVDLRKKDIPGTCAYCGGNFVGYKGKKFCCPDHRTKQWQQDNKAELARRKREKRAAGKQPS